MPATRLLAVAAFAFAASAAAQNVPNANYTDMWWNPAESGWGVSFMQHGGSHQAYATWYTYDPRAPDAATGQSKPLWIVMPGGTWTAHNVITGRAFVLDGTPYSQVGSNRTVTDVGTFTIAFSDVDNATFTFDLAAPAGLASTDPAFGLPPMSGSRALTRFAF